MDYDIIIAGCGFSGATIAHLAAKDGKRVLLLEKRGHIAGNMYDYTGESGILVQKYGPHSMHTNNKRVVDFLTGLWDWDEYILRARAIIDEKATPVPFNFQTIDDYYTPDDAKELKRRLAMCYNGAEKVPVVEMLLNSDPMIRGYAEFLFEKDYRPYTAKQWGIPPEELDVSVLKRVPVRLSYVDRYFDDEWQVLPKGGYTALFEKLLDSTNITLKLNADILTFLKLADDGGILFDGEPLTVPLVYTGALDELFGCRFGKLPYRSLRFDFQTLDTDSYQATAGVAHPVAEGFTRITEYTKLPYQDGKGKTAICVEYPEPYGSEHGKEAYYPILTDESQKAAEAYRALAGGYSYLRLCGRLAEFKYYNMDEAIARAMDVYGGIADEVS